MKQYALKQYDVYEIRTKRDTLYECLPTFISNLVTGFTIYFLFTVMFLVTKVTYILIVTLLPCLSWLPVFTGCYDYTNKAVVLRSADISYILVSY